MTKLIAIEKREGAYFTAEREGIKGVCKILIVDETEGFRFNSIKDTGMARATPNMRAIFQTGTNEAYIKLE